MFVEYGEWKKCQDLVDVAFFIRQDTERLDRLHGITAAVNTANFAQVKSTLSTFMAERAARENADQALDAVIGQVDGTLEREEARQETRQDTPAKNRVQTRNAKRKAKAQVSVIFLFLISWEDIDCARILIGVESSRRNY